jgi:uncharacterized protein YeaO (DUF488 family)
VSLLLTPNLYGRIHTASVYSGAFRQEHTARILVMRWYPARIPHGFFHAWDEHLAPDATLLRAYRQHTIAWEELAYEYLTALCRLPLAAVRSECAAWLRTYDSVTLLCCEHAPQGDEAQVRCHRRLLKAWLCDEELFL